MGLLEKIVNYIAPRTPELGAILSSTGIGYSMASAASRTGMKLNSPSGKHIHHDVIGAAILGFTLAAHGFKVIPREIAMIGYGLGAGILVHHLINEPGSCPEGEHCIRLDGFKKRREIPSSASWG